MHFSGDYATRSLVKMLDRCRVTNLTDRVIAGAIQDGAVVAIISGVQVLDEVGKIGRLDVS